MKDINNVTSQQWMAESKFKTEHQEDQLLIAKHLHFMKREPFFSADYFSSCSWRMKTNVLTFYLKVTRITFLTVENVQQGMADSLLFVSIVCRLCRRMFKTIKQLEKQGCGQLFCTNHLTIFIFLGKISMSKEDTMQLWVFALNPAYF